MKKHKLLLSLLSVLVSSLIFAQSPETVRNYIATYKDIAIQEMQRTGVPAAITLAQGIHETGAGTSDLVIASNNHFGIKCKSDWTGPAVYHDDDAKGECFRKYSDPFDSYRDHSDFLKNRPYYADLFELDPTDYKSWAFGLKKDGYATNPKYAQILIKIIEDYNLEDYTLIALNRKPEEGTSLASNTNTVKSESSEEAKAAIIPAVQKTIVYPTGVFKINETRVVFVSKGTAFLKVADENNVSLSRLFEFNDMKPEDIADQDELIYVQRKRKQGASNVHIVGEGETLFSIAQAEGIRLDNLMEFNLLKTGMQPQVGEKLNLQEKAAAAPKLVSVQNKQDNSGIVPVAQTVPVNETVTVLIHTVQPKETVYAIARKYEVSIDEVMKWNGMDSTELKTGQTLRINKKSANATN